MEVEKTHQPQQPPCKLARIGNNGRAKNNPDEEKSDNNEMIKMNTVGVSTTANCLNGWHQSRIIRVSRASGGKDRHSKVWTSKGLRDRRVRLSVQTAIQFYDLQDRLGYDQPSKAVEWLIKAAADAIAELPSLNAPSLFPNTPKQQLSDEKKHRTETPSQQQQCSSTSDTGLSLSRLEKRVKARERARDRTAKDKDVEINTNNRNGNNHFNDGETFTELLTTGIESNSHNSQMGYAFGRNQPQFHMGNSTLFSIDVSGEPHHPQMQQFSFIPDYIPVSAATMSSSGGGGDVYNLNFSALSSSSAGGFNGGTLQSNNTISSSFLSPNHLQRFSHPLESSVPFFFGAAAPTLSMENHQFPGGLQLYGDGSRHSDHKGKPKH